MQIEPMVGRTSRGPRAREMPEADELVRGEPDLLELVSKIAWPSVTRTGRPPDAAKRRLAP